MKDKWEYQQVGGGITYRWRYKRAGQEVGFIVARFQADGQAVYSCHRFTDGSVSRAEHIGISGVFEEAQRVVAGAIPAKAVTP